MKLINTKIDGFFLIESEVFEDGRGFFLETYSEKKFNTLGIKDVFVQDNHSHSTKGVLRGMHFQLKKPQAQVVSVIRGKIFDVVVDLRRNSSTFGQWEGIEISDKSDIRHVYMCPGLAHGFLTLSDTVDLHYKVSRLYNPEDECGLIWNDPDINIDWPKTNYKVSKRDMGFESFSQLIGRL